MIGRHSLFERSVAEQFVLLEVFAAHITKTLATFIRSLVSSEFQQPVRRRRSWLRRKRDYCHPTNVDDIIRGIKREINKAKGQALAAATAFHRLATARHGNPGSLHASNGFMSADRALNGTGATDSEFTTSAGGLNYMGVTHYASNLLTAGHVIAGVKRFIT